MRRGVNWSTTTCPPSAGSCAARRAATIGFQRWSRPSCGANSSGCAGCLSRLRALASSATPAEVRLTETRMYVFKKHVSRRTVLKGVGATIALPLLDAMNPAATAWAQTAAGSTPKRFAFIGFPHGAIMDRWSPRADRHQLRDVADPPAAGAVPPAPDHRLGVAQQAGRNARASRLYRDDVADAA